MRYSSGKEPKLQFVLTGTAAAVLLLMAGCSLDGTRDAGLEQAGAPTFSPDGGTYDTAQNVVLSTATADASIHYTTDGLTVPSPTTGFLYTDPVAIASTATLQAVAFKTGWTSSAVVSRTYRIQVAAPTFIPAGGTYHQNQSVTIAEATSGAVVLYTTDSSDPTHDGSGNPTGTTQLYSSPIAVNRVTTIKAVGYKPGLPDSDVANGSYVLKVADPEISPPDGAEHYSSAVVSISCSTSGVGIRCTTDGTIPTATTGDVYTTMFWIYASSTIRAIAFKDGWEDSAVTVAAITLKTWAPVISPSSGSYSTSQSVSMSSATPGATIRYFERGTEVLLVTDPTSTSGNLFSTAFDTPIKVIYSIKAIAYKAGLSDSLLSSVTYIFDFARFVTASGGTYYVTDPGNSSSYGEGLRPGSSYDMEQDGAGKVVSVGPNGGISYSTNKGISWSNATSGTSAVLTGVAYNGVDRWVAVGYSGTVLYSTDGGATWSPGNSGTANNLQEVVYHGGNRWVAVGSAGTVLYSTDGGASWSAGVSGTTTALYGLASDSSRLVSTGVGGLVKYSTDGGANWTAGASGTTSNLFSVDTNAAGRWVAVGAGETVVHSIDGGVNWSSGTSISTADLLGVCYGNGNWLAVGEEGVIRRSTDGGLNWHYITGGFSTQIFMGGITYCP